MVELDGTPGGNQCNAIGEVFKRSLEEAVNSKPCTNLRGYKILPCRLDTTLLLDRLRIAADWHLLLPTDPL